MMITTAILPLIDSTDDRAELRDDRLRMEAAPVPCLGADGCRGVDAGVGSAAMDITADFEWLDGPESVDYWGLSNVGGTTGYCSYLSTVWD